MTKPVERAVVLAAGLGSRLKWLTDTRPKALMQVAGEPVIAHVIRALVAQGIQDIVVNAFHHAEQLRVYLGDGSKFGCRLSVSYEDELLDSGGGVKQALELLPGDGPFAVCNADVLGFVDMRHLARELPEKGTAIALVPNPSHHPDGDFSLNRGYVEVDGDERFTFSGVSIWHADAFAAYQSGEVFSLIEPMREFIANKQCRGLVYRGPWFDIGRPRDLMQANRMMGGL